MNVYVKFAYVFMLGAVVLLAPDYVLAADGLENTVGKGLCNIVTSLKGTVGKGIATLTVLFLGIGAFFGKVNWGLLVMTAVGIAAIFGASSIVSVIGAGTGECTTGTFGTTP